MSFVREGFQWSLNNFGQNQATIAEGLVGVSTLLVEREQDGVTED
jgi:hypothetical protein